MVRRGAVGKEMGDSSPCMYPLYPLYPLRMKRVAVSIYFVGCVKGEGSGYGSCLHGKHFPNCI